jgi:hypothetical protein
MVLSWNANRATFLTIWLVVPVPARESECRQPTQKGQ